MKSPSKKMDEVDKPRSCRSRRTVPWDGPEKNTNPTVDRRNSFGCSLIPILLLLERTSWTEIIHGESSLALPFVDSKVVAFCMSLILIGLLTSYVMCSFGYVVEGEDFLRDIKEGDIIVSAKVTEGIENLVRPK